MKTTCLVLLKTMVSKKIQILKKKTNKKVMILYTVFYLPYLLEIKPRDSYNFVSLQKKGVQFGGLKTGGGSGQGTYTVSSKKRRRGLK